MALVVFLDIQGAFNNVTAKAVKWAMLDHDLPGNIVNSYGQYLLTEKLTLTQMG